MHNKQHNLCLSLISWEKKNFFNNISTHDITDNKMFWKTGKPLFIGEVETNSEITLIEKSCFWKRARANSF